MNQVKYTLAPYRFPSKVGTDVNRLRKYFRLESRERVLRELKSFIEVSRKRKEPQIALVIAEWGEGKTSLYQGFLERLDEEVTVLYVEGRRFVNFIRKLYRREILEKGELEGYRTLSAILLSLSEKIYAEEKGTKTKKYEISLPDAKDFDNTIDYVHECLDHIFENYKYTYIFLDEFEEILTLDDKEISSVFSGLVDIMNGYVTEIGAKGIHAGKFHIIICVTPPAYQKIRGYRAETINRLLQRITSINIPRLSDEECLKFIHGLILHCYRGKLPRPYPIEPLKLLNTITIISMRNLRAMVDLISYLLSSAKIESEEEGFKDKIRVITPLKFIDYLMGKKIEVYGGEVDLVNEEILKTLTEYWEEYSKYFETKKEDFLVLKYLCSVIFPSSIKEISTELNLSELDVLKSFDKIERFSYGEIKERFGINLLFYRLKKLEGDYIKNRDKLTEILKRIELRPEDIDKIINQLTFTKAILNKNELSIKKEIYFPELDLENAYKYLAERGIELGKDSLSVLIKEITSGEINLSNEAYYIASPKFLNFIYPSPEVMLLDFIKDKSLRMEIWRECIGEILEDDFKKSLPILFPSIGISLEKSKLYDFTLKYPYKGEIIEINTCIRSSLGNLGEKTVSEVYEEIINLARNRKEPLPHLVIFFYWGDIMPMASKYIEKIEKGLYIKVLPFGLQHIQVIQIASIGRTLRKIKDEIDIPIETFWKILKNRWEGKKGVFGEIEEKLEKHIDIDVLLNRFHLIADSLFLEKNLEKFLSYPSVICPISREIIHEEDKQASCYLYYLIYPQDELIPEDVFNFIKDNIWTFQFYGSKKSIIGTRHDFEDSKNQFTNACKDFVNNHLFSYAKNNKYKISISPVEQRIIKILEDVYEGWCDIESIDNSFIKLTGAPKNIIDTYYLKILEGRGKIEKEKNLRIRSLEFGEIKTLVENYYKLFVEKYRNYEDIIDKYGYFGTIKEKGYRLMILRYFKEVVDTFYQVYSTKGLYDENLGRRIGFILIRLVKYFLGEDFKKGEYYPLGVLRKSNKDIIEKKREIEKNIEKFDEIADALIIKLTKFGIEIKYLEEKNELSAFLDDINNIIDKKFQKEELDRILFNEWKNKGKNSEFYFKHEKYNPSIKYWLINRKLKEINIDKFIKKVREINEEIDEILNKKDRWQKNLEELEKNEIIKILVSPYRRVDISPPNIEGITTLDDIADLIKVIKNKQEKLDESFANTYKRLIKLGEKENKLINNLDELEKLNKFLLKSFNKKITGKIDYFKNGYKNIINNLRNIEITIDNISEVIKRTENDINNLEESISKFLTKIEEYIHKIKTELENIVVEINLLKNICEKLGISDIDKKNIERFLSSVKESIVNLEERESFNYKKILENFYKIKSLLRSRIADKLTDNELNVYTKTITLIKDRGEIKLPELIKELQKIMKFDEKEIEDIIFKLIKLNLLEIVIRGS